MSVRKQFRRTNKKTDALKIIKIKGISEEKKRATCCKILSRKLQWLATLKLII